jgi:hypothetical protein
MNMTFPLKNSRKMPILTLFLATSATFGTQPDDAKEGDDGKANQILESRGQTRKRPLFEGIRHFEEGHFEAAAEIFASYAGKPYPVAQPYCAALAQKGYLKAFVPVESIEHPEEEKAALWFKASQKLPALHEMTEAQLNRCIRRAKTKGHGPLLYLLGSLPMGGRGLIYGEEP